jgi:hypothetical protein
MVKRHYHASGACSSLHAWEQRLDEIQHPHDCSKRPTMRIGIQDGHGKIRSEFQRRHLYNGKGTATYPSQNGHCEAIPQDIDSVFKDTNNTLEQRIEVQSTDYKDKRCDP